jgi:uncharacterized damage-inducible protein DinB
MPVRIAPPAANEYIAYYGKYIALVGGDDALPPMERQLADSLALLAALDDKRALHRYAEGKWSVKEVVGHLADGERIFACRALRFAREDMTPLPGFEENEYVPAGRFDRMPLADLLDQWKAIRAASITLFRSLDERALGQSGKANDSPVTPRALAWIICGHELHHRAILRDRYGLGA